MDKETTLAEHALGLSWPRNGQAQKKLINWFVSV